MPKAFHFSLKRIQQYKEQILDAEKAKLASLNQEKIALLEREENLIQFLAAKSAEMQERGRLTALALSGYKYYRESTRNQIEEIEKELAALEIKIEAQQQVVLKASQELSGLDKLEEKRLEEYRKEEAKEFEQQIAEGLVFKLVGEKG